MLSVRAVCSSSRKGSDDAGERLESLDEGMEMEGLEGRDVMLDWERMKVSSGTLSSKLLGGSKWGKWLGRGRSGGVVY
jgi:hypothetical protein